MNTKKVYLKIYGMSCQDCVETISKGLKDQEGIVDLNISLENGIGEVIIDADKVKPEELLHNKVFSKPYHYKAIIIDQ